MKVLTHRPLPSALIEMSTGNGIFEGSPMVATSLACHWPAPSCLTSHSLDVNAVAVIAQLSVPASDQRTSSGAPGTSNTLVGFIDFRSHIAIVAPKFFIALPSATSLPKSIM